MLPDFRVLAVASGFCLFFSFLLLILGGVDAASNRAAGYSVFVALWSLLWATVHTIVTNCSWEDGLRSKISVSKALVPTDGLTVVFLSTAIIANAVPLTSSHGNARLTFAIITLYVGKAVSPDQFFDTILQDLCIHHCHNEPLHSKA